MTHQMSLPWKFRDLKRAVFQIFPAIFLFLILAFAFLACSPPDTETGNWKELLTRQHRELTESLNAVDKIGADLPERLTLLKKRVYLLESRFGRLMMYFDLASGNPLVLRDMMGVISWFEATMERLISPFKREAASLNRLMEDMSDLSLKIKGEMSSMDNLGSPAVSEKANAYLKDLTGLGDKARSLSKIMVTGLKPAEDFELHLEKARARIEGQYRRVLETHLLKPAASFFSGEAWPAGLAAARKWASDFGMYILEPLELRKSRWLMLMAKIVLFSLFLMAACWIALTRRGNLFGSLSPDIRLLPSCLMGSIGLGILAATSFTGLFPSTFFFTVATVFVVRGLISLSRNLWLYFFPESASHPDMLPPLWAVVSAAALSQALHIPEEVFIPVWAFWLLGLCWHYARSLSKKKGWEKVTGLVMVWAMPVLALLAVIGWGYLSMLLGKLLIMFALDWRLARCTSTGLGRLRARWEKRAGGDPQKFEGKSLGFPLIFLTLLILSVAWACMLLGGFSLFFELVRYQLGWDRFTFSLSRIIVIFALLFVTRAGIALARSGIGKLPGRHKDLDAGSVQSLETIVTYALWSLFILTALGLIGISFRNLAVIAGGLSVGLGFGMQNIVNNFIGGLILLFGRSIQPGDLLEVDNVRGHVTKVTIRNTVVQSFAGATIFVPNSTLISQKMINWSHRDHRYRQHIDVGVSYDSDIEKVTELLLQAARQSPKVLDMPPPRVRFLDFGESTLNFSLRIWIRGWGDRYADSEVRYHINRIFRENGIEISFPQRDLHIRSAEGLKGLGRDNK